ncbi:alpha/beta hydrolase [Nocardioides sp.]|jgi:pimeloyl-ACP methyl ester carboxylesterase|uniref:alpha/beta hydrolase n=1 Tax=Nocardioides sp. TaxID=35761 RepID=UPI002F42AD03
MEDSMETAKRSKVWFSSGGVECAAWHYVGTNGACVVMAGGAGVTKEPGTDQFATRFHAAGFSVLAFDFRRFGESGGAPRQVLRVGEQLADWEAAVACAKALPEVDPLRVAVWGFSTSGGHVLRVGAGGRVAAVVAQTPFVDGLVSGPNALRHETVGVVLRFPFIALTDLLRGLFRRPPLCVPLAGPRGAVAMLTTPDALDSERALNPGGRYPEWKQTIAARSVMRVLTYRPGRAARRIRVPLLVVVAEQDQSVLAKPAVRLAARVANATLVEVPGGHYAPFLGQHEPVIAAELAFLRTHLRVS